MQVGMLRENAGSGEAQSGTAPSPRLVRAAHEFEGQMMKELLKPLTDENSPTGAEDDSGFGADGALGQFASEALGQALSAHGGLGIGDRIVKTLCGTSNRNGSSTVTGDLHKNTGIRTAE